MLAIFFTLGWSLLWLAATGLLWRLWAGRSKIYGLFLISLAWLEGFFVLLPRLMGWH